VNPLLAVAVREVSDRRRIFGAAAAFALLSVVVAIVAGSSPRGDAVRVTSAILAAGVCWFLAALLGATFVGREVTENRLPFYFSRPLSPGAIWFGKMAGAVVLLLCAFAIIITPFLVVELAKAAPWWSAEVSAYLRNVSLVAVGLFFASHLLSTMARSRSPWITLDVVCAVLSFLAFRAILEFPESLSATEVEEKARLIMLCGMPIVIFVSGFWQLRGGRADRLQQHRALSRFLWGGAALFLFAGASYTAWAMVVPPGDLLGPHGLRAGGDWALVSGKTLGRGGYEPTLLLNADGRYVRLFIPPDLIPEFRFSADGRAAVWLRGSAAGHELVHCLLDVRRPHPEGTGILAEHIAALSPDGSLTITGSDVLTVHDLAAKRLRGTFRFADSTGRPTIEILSDDRVRAYAPVVHGLAALEVREFDLRSGGFRQEDAFWVPWPWTPTELRYGVSRILIAREGGTSAQMLDGRTGRSFAMTPNQLWPVRVRGKVEWTRDDVRDLRFETEPVFLSDGTVAAPLYSVEPPPGSEVSFETSARPSEARDSSMQSWTLTPSGGGMAIFSGDDGHGLAMIALGPWRVQRVEGGDRHRVLVTARKANAPSATLAWLDFDRGVFQPLDMDVRPIVDSMRPLPKEILCETETSIVAWNPASGALRMVAGN
jgi:hypothetical protein